MFCDTDTPSSAPVDPSATMPLDQLEREICEWAAQLAAAEARWLALIAELDRRKGYERWGLASCAHWLSWKCGLAPGAARERVRVARALEELPAIDATFRRGELSYSKVRALTRVATPATEHDLLELAVNATAHQLELIVRAWRRCVDADDAARARAVHAGRSLTWYHDDDGSMVGQFRLPPEEDSILVHAVEARMERPHPGDDAGAEGGPPASAAQRRADALVEAADASLGARTRVGDERTMTVIEVDLDTMTNGEPGRCQLRDGNAIAVETARRLACDSSTVVLERDATGSVVSVGNPTKSIPRGVRRALRRRDQNRCVFPGCTTSRWVEAHHIVHRAHGGSHELHNLATLCRRHHHLVHEGGFSIETHDGGRTFRFRRPDGSAIPDAGVLGPAEPDDVRGRNQAAGTVPTALTLQGGIGERLDLELTIWALGTKHLRPSDVPAGTPPPGEPAQPLPSS